jgi:polysaccharide biosynthesis/export protein
MGAFLSLAVPSSTVQAQQTSSPSLVEVVQRLRQAMVTSGLTPEQIRARLSAAGLDQNVLDPYYPGTPVRLVPPSNEVFLAIRNLGLADAAELAYLQQYTALRADSASRAALTSGDSARRRDSLAFASQRAAMRADVNDSLARRDSGYNIFGLETFRSAAGRFEPTLYGPVDQNYRLGPGDQLVLILTGDVESTMNLEVAREGFVLIPQVGQIYVANLTLAQLEDLLYTRLGRVYSGIRRGPGATTRFSVTISRLRTNQIFVLGDVERPGSYQVSSAGTSIAALYAAGGPTPNGSFRNVEIKRANRVVSSLDLYDYLLRGDASRDARLETGDIVFVPPRGLRVRIVGEVIRPATYELKPTETLADLVRAAGGFRAEASRRLIQIERIVPAAQRVGSGRDRITVDIRDDQGVGAEAFRLEPGDVVRVFAVAERVRNTVHVRGNVWAPGRFALEPGMMVGDALRRAGGPRPDVYLGQVLVTRFQADSTRVQLRASLRDSLGTVINDFPLREDDLVEVFSVGDFVPDHYVVISGAIRSPGRFPYRQGMTLRDLVLLADGLQESAYLREAEIARLPADRSGATTALSLRVSLDSSYLFRRNVANGLNPAAEVPLQPYDNVLVLQQPNWELQRIVTVTGEVAFPGSYALTTRGERLSDLIRRAGGFTSEAYPEGTFFNRRQNNVGRVAVDVPRALRQERSPENLVLMDRDVIHVPQRSFVVTVQGEVNAPNVVAYVEGAGLAYYIEQAGGVSRTGDKRSVYVTQPNGKRQTGGWGRDPKPLAGSIVSVPVAGPRTPFLQSLASFLTTIAGIVTTVILIESVTSN